ncbi:MAG: hypothetical protein N3I86_04520 [Verrucomicrobiae bacterium]|nr:hypothetical protein [Verrucomicrobiae bacterium]
MTLLLDMVHHNPGEPPFASRYTDPAFLAQLGYSGQVLKHLNACVPLDTFPASDAERQWLSAAQAARDAEITDAKAAGLDVYYHVDLFVLPRCVVESRRAELCDANGRVDLTRPAVLELHRALFSALFARYPQVDGLVTRVGETYLFDTPHHAGNTAVPMHDPNVGREEMIRRFTLLVRFLREEICVRHGRRLIYRTWDYFGDRFHADADFYRAVTDAVEPHPNLLFSIKHTAGDFFRGCKPNPCLGVGRHPQIVEVQCAREYEGKGAYPNYIARGVIEGFREVPEPCGLRDWARSPLFAGVWTWSRGGGWYGPYLAHEFWPDLNARVLAAWTRDPATPEAEHFRRVCRQVHGMNDDSIYALREICDVAEQAIWLGRSVPEFARLRQFADCDSAWLWMRDDRLGGLEQLGEMFRLLEQAGRLDAAVAEKREAARLFATLPARAAHVRTADPATTDAIRTSTEYGARLFALIALGWELMVRRWRARNGISTEPVRESDLGRFQAALASYRQVATLPGCASLYQLTYWSWPGQPPAPGMEASVLGDSHPAR